MKIPAIRAHIGDWVYYIATMRFKDVSKYVKRVDNEVIPTFVWDFSFQPSFRPSDSFQLFCGISVFTPNFG